MVNNALHVEPFLVENTGLSYCFLVENTSKGLESFANQSFYNTVICGKISFIRIKL